MNFLSTVHVGMGRNIPSHSFRKSPLPDFHFHCSYFHFIKILLPPFLSRIQITGMSVSQVRCIVSQAYLAYKYKNCVQLLLRFTQFLFFFQIRVLAAASSY